MLKAIMPLIDLEGGLDLLHHMGEDPDAVIDRSVDTGFQFLSCICFQLLELGCFKLVLTDHQRPIQPFLKQGAMINKDVGGMLVYAEKYMCNPKIAIGQNKAPMNPLEDE